MEVFARWRKPPPPALGDKVLIEPKLLCASAGAGAVAGASAGAGGYGLIGPGLGDGPDGGVGWPAG